MWLLLYEYLWEWERRKTVSHISLNRKAVHYSLRQVLCVPVSWITPTTGIKVKQMSNKSNSLSTYHLIKPPFHLLPSFLILSFCFCLLNSFLSMHVTVQEFFEHYFTHTCAFCKKVCMCVHCIWHCACIHICTWFLGTANVCCFDGAVGVCGEWFYVYVWRTLLKHSGVTCFFSTEQTGSLSHLSGFLSAQV